MNNEIKEILIKDFNEILVKEFCTDWKEKRLYIELLVNSTPFSNLLDYITNLQQENERLKKRNKEIYDGFLATQEELTDYAEENEKLKKKFISKRVKISLALELIKDYNMEKVRQNKESFNEWLNDLLNILNGDNNEKNN